MATYLYCIRNDPHAVPSALPGIDGLPVRALYATGLTAWVSDVDDAPVTPTVERVKAHDAICAAALAAGETPLPVRFGQTFTDDAAVASAIAARRPALRELLGRLAGCVELRVVVTRGRETSDQANALADENAAMPAGGTRGRGTAFLRRLAQQGRADLARDVGCEELRHAVRAAAAAYIVEQQQCEAARGVSYFPLLVRRSELGARRAAIAASLPSQGIEAALLGPFPPYSFAGDV
jgi:hypothetical protein